MGRTKGLCRGKLKVLKRERGHSAMNQLLGGNSNVVYTSYKCEHGHEYETTGTDKQCTTKKSNDISKKEKTNIEYKSDKDSAEEAQSQVDQRSFEDYLKSKI